MDPENQSGLSSDELFGEQSAGNNIQGEPAASSVDPAYSFSEPVASNDPATVPAPQPIVNSLPVEEQVYAPQPSVLVNQPEVTQAPQATPPLSQPSAMVSDPLYGNGQVPVQQMPYSGDTYSVNPEKPPKSNFFTKKRLIIIGSSMLGLLLLVLGGYFGYQYYISSSNERILLKAGENLANSKEMSTTATIGVDDLSIKVKLDVDKNQNFELSTSLYSFPIEIFYLNNKDSAYVKDFVVTSESSNGKSYFEYKNVKKAYETASKTLVNLKDFDPKKNYFTSENMKYITRNPDESVGGHKLYKFTFKPTKAYMDKAIKDLKGSQSDFPFELSNVDMTVSVWIDQGSFKVTKVDGNIGVQVKYADSTMLNSSDQQKDFRLSWSEDFDYSYHKTIKLPTGYTISQSFDTYELINSTFGPAAKQKATDSTKKAVAREVQNALEQYYLDNNNKYPVTSDVNAMKNALVSAKLTSGSIDLTGFTYSSSGSDYTLKFKLTYQEDSNSANVVGTAPNKYYELKGMQAGDNSHNGPI